MTGIDKIVELESGVPAAIRNELAHNILVDNPVNRGAREFVHLGRNQPGINDGVIKA